MNLAKLSSEQSSPIFSLGGFTQWKRAEATIWAFRNLLDIEIDMLCLFDRDYRSEPEVENFIGDMAKRNLHCIVFQRKEIENYLLSPQAIARCLATRLRQAGKDDSVASVNAIIDLIVSIGDEQKNFTTAQITSNAMRFAREQRSGEDDASIISKSSAKFDAEWAEIDGLCRLAPGKELLKNLFGRIQANYGVSISVAMIQDHMRLDEIDEEIVDILNRLNRFFEA